MGKKERKFRIEESWREKAERLLREDREKKGTDTT